jgi:hypothetical protein
MRAYAILLSLIWCKVVYEMFKMQPKCPLFCVCYPIMKECHCLSVVVVTFSSNLNCNHNEDHNNNHTEMITLTV